MRRQSSGLADWHVFNVGSRRMALFRDELDANVFLARVRKAGGLTGVVVWAYTLMTNHFHMVVRASSDQLGRFMHHLQRMYSRYHNRRYGLRGHAYAGPYGAVRQSGFPMLVRTIAYVFMNPVRAYQVESPGDWNWTSYRSFMGVGESRLWVNALPLLGEIDPDLHEARLRVEEAIGKARLRMQRTREPLKDPTTTDVHAEHFEWLLERATERANEVDGWDPVYLALLWARDIGIFRGGIAKVLGGPLGGTRRAEFQGFRRWLEAEPDRLARLRIP